MLEEKVSMMAEWERVWPLRAIVRSGSASAWRLVAENVVEVFNAGMPLKKHSHTLVLYYTVLSSDPCNFSIMLSQLCNGPRRPRSPV